ARDLGDFFLDGLEKAADRLAERLRGSPQRRSGITDGVDRFDDRRVRHAERLEPYRLRDVETRQDGVDGLVDLVVGALERVDDPHHLALVRDGTAGFRHTLTRL